MSNSIRAALRTATFTFLGVLVPGMLTWLHDVSEWATNRGATPFPVTSTLVYLAVAALVAGVTALLNALWVWLEQRGNVPRLFGASPRYGGR